MEREPGACDLYGNHSVSMRDGRTLSVCQLFSERKLFQPEPHTRQAIASFLGGCSARNQPCRAIDLGSNGGWTTAMMLSLGAHVTAVEPQPDLAAALKSTVELNCWTHRATVIHAAVTQLKPAAAPPLLTIDMNRDVYRLARRHFPPAEAIVRVPVVSIDDVLWAQAADGVSRTGTTSLPSLAYDLIKIDVDSIDGQLLHTLLLKIQRGQLSVRTILVECTGCRAETLHALHAHGYHAYLLDNTDGRRFLNGAGQDLAAGFQPLSNLDPELQERFAQRLLRHVYYVLPTADLRAWRRINTPSKHLPPGWRPGWRSPKAPREFIFTLEQLDEPELDELLCDCDLGRSLKGSSVVSEAAIAPVWHVNRG